ncbi:hypothetical protein Hdeb2414_s0011g00370901 [Helianthus debilis subsp. tardiflorus]
MFLMSTRPRCLSDSRFHVVEPPKFDQDLWKRTAGGMKKGKVYGLGVVTDPYVHGSHDPEIEKLNKVIKEFVKEKEEDKERFNGFYRVDGSKGKR